VRRTGGSLSLALLALLLAVPAPAVTISIINADAAGTGLNDPTPASPVGGNPGTTIGQQRLNAFKEAARIWGQILPGNVEIRDEVSFLPLDCSSTSAVLEQAGPTYVEADFANAPLAGTWYVVAEANQFAGQELEPGESHMITNVNSQLGQAGCLDGWSFYYGFDTNGPPNSVNALTVALHELAHGLGFISLADESTGKLCCSPTLLPDIFDAFVYDTTMAKSWNQMTSDASRKASAINTGNLVWNGPAANAAGSAYLGMPFLRVTAPAAAAGTYSVGTADFGSPLTASSVTGTLVAALDPSDPNGASTTDACSPLTNASAVAGNIALVDRGSCNFTTKAENVQAAGAIGLVIANNVSGPAPGLGGSDPAVTIPVVSVSQADGVKLRANLPATAAIGLDKTRPSGMNANGQLLLYAPNPVEAGSSVSHWDTSPLPDLLMEPYINSDLPIGVDVTVNALWDIGWFGAASGAAPVAGFTFFSATPKAGDRVQFTDTSTGSPTSWSWDFGDGVTSTLQNPAHTFGKGTWQVSLTASNTGGSDTVTKSVVVSFSGPVACTSDTHTMCMVGGRYKVTSHWKNQYAGGVEATLSKALLTDTTGAFWMFDAATYEYLIRFNTATDNGRIWIAIPTFTDVEFWIAVFDTQNGQYNEYHSPPGNRTLIYDPYFFMYP
jgi:hypothetical protein